ncbi:MAG TPA: mitomycin resistance protein [Desulfonatronum sp.]|nr:mitomycin resistance protein [Desulfonatronum sp.]
MHPAKVDRDRLQNLTDLPNIGRAMAEDLRQLGIRQPAQLAGMDPLEMYDRLCATIGARQDPCVLDVFMSIVSFMNGEAPRPWWEFTEKRMLLRENHHARPTAGVANARPEKTL